MAINKELLYRNRNHNGLEYPSDNLAVAAASTDRAILQGEKVSTYSFEECKSDMDKLKGDIILPIPEDDIHLANIVDFEIKRIEQSMGCKVIEYEYIQGQEELFDGEAFYNPIGFNTSKVKEDAEELDELLSEVLDESIRENFITLEESRKRRTPKTKERVI